MIKKSAESSGLFYVNLTLELLQALQNFYAAAFAFRNCLRISSSVDVAAHCRKSRNLITFVLSNLIQYFNALAVSLVQKHHTQQQLCIRVFGIDLQKLFQHIYGQYAMENNSAVIENDILIEV